MGQNCCRRKIHSWVLILMITAGTICGSYSPSSAQENRLGFGTDIGFITGTADDTVFAFGMNLDYYLDPAFSLGPMLILSPTGDLTEIAIAGVARFHIRLPALNIVPFAGIGFVHADLDSGMGPNRIDTSDTSFYLPIGLAAEFPVSDKISLSTSLVVNIHDLSFDAPVERDQTSIAVLFGIRFGA